MPHPVVAVWGEVTGEEVPLCSIGQDQAVTHQPTPPTPRANEGLGKQVQGQR